MSRVHPPYFRSTSTPVTPILPLLALSNSNLANVRFFPNFQSFFVSHPTLSSLRSHHFFHFRLSLLKSGPLFEFSDFQSFFALYSTLSSLRSHPFCHFWLSAIQIWPTVKIFKISVIFCASVFRFRSGLGPVAPGGSFQHSLFLTPSHSIFLSLFSSGLMPRR